MHVGLVSRLIVMTYQHVDVAFTHATRCLCTPVFLFFTHATRQFCTPHAMILKPKIVTLHECKLFLASCFTSDCYSLELVCFKRGHLGYTLSAEMACIHAIAALHCSDEEEQCQTPPDSSQLPSLGFCNGEVSNEHNQADCHCLGQEDEISAGHQDAGR